MNNLNIMIEEMHMDLGSSVEKELEKIKNNPNGISNKKYKCYNVFLSDLFHADYKYLIEND